MTLHELNTLKKPELHDALARCCGSEAWIQKMIPFFPADDLVELLEDAEEQWYKCTGEDWKEAFTHHPKIGDIESVKNKFASTEVWATTEQSSVNTATRKVLEKLASDNRAYEEKFGYIFIVCATGKSAEEMLQLLEVRLKNDPATEIEVAADEQNKITKLRLEKLIE